MGEHRYRKLNTVLTSTLDKRWVVSLAL